MSVTLNKTEAGGLSPFVHRRRCLKSLAGLVRQTALLPLLAVVLLLDFHKCKFELWLIKRQPIRRAIDWVRAIRPKLFLQITTVRSEVE
jgi:hypothetical protein